MIIKEYFSFIIKDLAPKLHVLAYAATLAATKGYIYHLKKSQSCSLPIPRNNKTCMLNQQCASLVTVRIFFELSARRLSVYPRQPRPHDYSLFSILACRGKTLVRIQTVMILDPRSFPKLLDTLSCYHAMYTDRSPCRETVSDPTKDQPHILKKSLIVLVTHPSTCIVNVACTPVITKKTNRR